MAEYYASKEDFEKAKDFLAKVEKLMPTLPWVTWMMGYIAARTGDRQKALQVIDDLKEQTKGSATYNYIAFVYCALGDFPAFFENINRALETKSVLASVVMYSPLFAAARADPRYAEFLTELRRRTWQVK